MTHVLSSLCAEPLVSARETVHKLMRLQQFIVIRATASKIRMSYIDKLEIDTLRCSLVHRGCRGRSYRWSGCRSKHDLPRSGANSFAVHGFGVGQPCSRSGKDGQLSQGAQGQSAGPMHRHATTPARAGRRTAPPIRLYQ